VTCSIQFNSIQFSSLSKIPLDGVTHMDIEIVREYIYIYKVIQISVEYSGLSHLYQGVHNKE